VLGQGSACAKGGTGEGDMMQRRLVAGSGPERRSVAGVPWCNPLHCRAEAERHPRGHHRQCSSPFCHEGSAIGRSVCVGVGTGLGFPEDIVSLWLPAADGGTFWAFWHVRERQLSRGSHPAVGGRAQGPPPSGWRGYLTCATQARHLRGFWLVHPVCEKKAPLLATMTLQGGALPGPCGQCFTPGRSFRTVKCGGPSPPLMTCDM